MRIDEVFDGEWKSPEEYLIKCPYCGDHKTHNHCFVNIVKGMFMCHFCSETGTVDRLMKDHGEGEQVERGPGIFEKTRHEETDFNEFKTVSGMKSTVDRMALTYLKDRGFDRKEIEKFDIRYGDFGRYFGRIIFPIKEDGHVVSFVSRSFLKAVKPKYLFPHHGETSLTTNECMWGWDKAMENGAMRVLITEGVIDAIALGRAGYYSVSLNSKQLGIAQKMKLLTLPKDVIFVVMLDGDAHRDGLKVAKSLRAFGRETYMTLLEKDEDPDSITVERLHDVLLTRTYPVDVNLALKVYLGI